MRLLLDPEDRWIGQPGRLRLAKDRLPVAVTDVVTVLKDASGVTIDVLANDVDREGPVTLVSAFGALGTAVAETNGTVTYTPPPDFTGFDTIVYEIEDSIGQRATGQVDVTITSPVLRVDTTAEGTLEVTAEAGPLDVTVETPPERAGTYPADPADLATGPLNLQPVAISGAGTVGATLAAVPGLWIAEDGSDTPVRSLQWRRDGADIAGAVAASYDVVTGDGGTDLTVAETLTNATGTRTVLSAPVSVASLGFTAEDDPLKIAWWDADAAATLTETSGAVSGWTDQVGGLVLAQTGSVWQPKTGQRSLAGRNVLDFDGSDHLTAPLTLPASGDFAVHAVLGADTVSNEYAALLAMDATADWQLDAGAATEYLGRLSVAGIGTSTALSGGPFSGVFVLSAIFDRTGTGTIEIFIGGTSRLSMAYTAPVDAAQTLHLMTNRAKNASIDGAVAELVLTSDLSARADYHGYLSDKWGLA